MGLLVNSRIVPTSAKLFIFAFALISLILFLTSSRSRYNYWRDESATNMVLFSGNTMYPSSIEEVTKIFMTGEKISVNRSAEDAFQLELLVNNPTDCFKVYEKQFMSTSSLKFPEMFISREKPSFFYMLYSFNNIMASLNIRVAVIEPSVLHCMLNPQYKALLAKRNFKVKELKGKINTITFGVIGDDITTLQKEDILIEFRSRGFQPYFVQTPLADWMIGHVFYSYYQMTIHVVVFHRRNGYLWHAELNSSDSLNVPRKRDLLFASYDSAYEKFNFVPLDMKWPNLVDIYIPSNAHYFLFQISSSRFLECNLTRAADVIPNGDSSTDSSSLEDFRRKTVVAYHELKKIFNPLLMHLWIFSGTMLGWYRQCDLIPYTSDVDFASWATEVDDQDLIVKPYLNNTVMTIIKRMGLPEEALEFNFRSGGISVDVFFLYKINNGSWMSGHRPSKGYYFRYYYPPFTLCSAELLQEKVLVPCETEEVIANEYGPNWMKPVKHWNYESSIYNRGPNIYWEEKRRPSTFQEY